jgi:hypothetical protein
VGLLPSGGDAASESKRHEEQGKRGDHEDDADDVELPEELVEETEAKLLEGGLVVGQVARLGRSVLSDVEHDDEEDAADYDTLAGREAEVS